MLSQHGSCCIKLHRCIAEFPAAEATPIESVINLVLGSLASSHSIGLHKRSERKVRGSEKVVGRNTDT